MYVDVLIKVLVLGMVVMMEFNLCLIVGMILFILMAYLIVLVLTNIFLDIYMNHMNKMMEVYLIYLRLSETLIRGVEKVLVRWLIHC